MTGINHITLNVVDIDAAFDLYVNILKFTPVMRSEFSAYFTVNNIWFAIVKNDIKNNHSRYDHIALYVDDLEKTKQQLIDAGIETWKENESEGDSFYFLDWSGNKFELHNNTLEQRIEYGKAHWDNNTIIWY